MHKRPEQQQKYYFSDRLKRQLAQISHHPLTIVEAPSGFGKTTAVREFLKENLPPGACEYWYTCLGEPASTAWMGICELFSNVDDKLADDLRSLKLPTMDTLFSIRSYFKDIRCHMETYLVVDNYQLINSGIPRELINVFSMHGNPRLHMIFITQQLEAKQQISTHNDNIHTIEAASFFLDRAGTASLFRMEGIRLSDEDLEKIYSSTEGWVSAVRLQIINFKETGSFEYNADIERLVETAIWNKLDREEKDFLISVSVLHNFTARQAAIMLNRDILPGEIEELLKSNDFIRYIPDKHLYDMHSILQDYLQNRLYHLEPEEYRNQVFRKAGASCAAVSQYYPAAEFYFKVKDFDAILSLPFSNVYMDEQKEKYPWDFIESVVHECPEDILCKHPRTMMAFSYQAIAEGRLDVYHKSCRLLENIIDSGDCGTRQELESIKGEYMLLLAAQAFNDLREMKEKRQAAWDLLKRPSAVFKPDVPSGFGTPSVLNMFWRESGSLETELALMDEMVPAYHSVTDRHGAGTNIMMRAEAMLMRGEEDQAEILCHKALYEARNHRQISVCLCAEVTMARIAILRGDAEGYFAAIKNIQNYAKEHNNLYILRMGEHCMSLLSLLLDIKDYVAPWLYDMESIKRTLYAPVVPFAQLLHLKLLLMDKRYNEFYGICQLILDESRNPIGNIKYMMPQVYQLIFLATAKRNNGEHTEAQNYLGQALEIALPDRVYLPFAEQECMEYFLPELNMRARGFASLMELCKRQRRGVEIIRKAILREKSPLTPREREIARLARDRLSAKEIGAKLYISEMTVRATLRSVYSKLDIHSKAELSLKEF